MWYVYMYIYIRLHMVYSQFIAGKIDKWHQKIGQGWAAKVLFSSSWWPQNIIKSAIGHCGYLHMCIVLYIYIYIYYYIDYWLLLIIIVFMILFTYYLLMWKHLCAEMCLFLFAYLCMELFIYVFIYFCNLCIYLFIYLFIHVVFVDCPNFV